MNKLLALGLSSLLISTNASALVQSTIDFKDRTGTVGYDVNISAFHYVHLKNDTDQPQAYVIGWDLTAAQKSPIHNEGHRILQPGESFDVKFQSTVKPCYHYEGSYGAVAATVVTMNGKVVTTTEKRAITYIRPR